MKASENPDIMRGLWIDFQAEFPEWLVAEKEGVLRVENENGTIVTYDGTNAAEMVGYFVPESIAERDEFTDRVYLAPVGNAQISEYADKGYTLSQTPGWN